MATWLTISANDLDDYLNAPQLAALRTAALRAGQADTFAAVMHGRCNYVRNRISQRIRISATAYAVPPELKDATAWLIIQMLNTRLPLALTDDQRTMVKQACSDLDIAGTDKLPISEPDDPITPDVQAGAAVQLGNTTTPLTRDDLEGF